ncbi:RadC family protein [Nitratifractor salsuginis]|uniref:DNA replication and repair protein RadC n=1 Tax=Nitratifractor salsuginis (strain DSM 16511 / JCM 12458 / E9I37-1) TaxID=749222 RepID=E6X308_NITSE|nr:DNA repair protein RadC [Nitratifractor salsuginis]ADV46152.1 DNA replication and repair protein RadC [Nitratifractor salsuginis DSM 16511]
MTSIQEMYHRDRPREKMAARGAGALKNEELLAVLLGSGIPGKDVRKLAREIAAVMEQEFDRLDLERLTQIHGLGPAKASQILAAIELSRRFLLSSRRQIHSAAEVYELLEPFANKSREHFLSVTLDGASRVIEVRTVFIGTLNQSLVHPREVFADAIADRAAGIIVAHNHPSGTLTPSRPDIAITDRLKEVGRLVGIDLLDHVILTKEGYFSFADEGML